MVYIFSTLFADEKKRLKPPNQVTLLWSRPKRPAEHWFGGGLAGDEKWMANRSRDATNKILTCKRQRAIRKQSPINEPQSETVHYFTSLTWLEGFQELTAWMAFGVVFIWLNPGPGDKQSRASAVHTSHWIPCFLHLI